MNNKPSSPSSNKRARNGHSENKKYDGNRVNKSNVHLKIEPAKQFDFFKQLMRKYENDEKHMLAKAWYLTWERFCLQLTQELPPSIDNSTLLLEDGSLKPALVLDVDFYLIPHGAWVHLVKWYGLLHPSFDILYVEKAKKIKPKLKPTPPPENKRRKWDITPSPPPTPAKEEEKIEFRVIEANKTIQKVRRFTISPKSTISEFQTSLLSALDITSGTNIELWLLNNNYIISSSSLFITKKLLENPKLAEYIDTTNIDVNSTISDHLNSMTSSSFTKSDHKYYHLAVEYISRRKSNGFVASANTSIPPGLCGLQNLGNTCYMNSALQCLSNTPQLTRWFLRGDYRKDINLINPLGLNGELAESFAHVIKSIWNNNQPSVRPSISPKDFKSVFERFNPHFIGYQQQDSQELLSFLLDGLHEDLNRILKKPYIEIPDFDDLLSDKEVATCFWNYHKARNDSIIVDLFQGQFKSRLICDECKKVSVTFDPFMYLSLPLPAETNCEIDVVYVPYLPSQRQQKMTIRLNKDAKVGHLKKEIENNIISVSLSISNNHSLLVVEMYHGKIFKILLDSDPVHLIRSSDNIYVYQLPCPSIPQTAENWVIFPVYCATTIDIQQQVIPSTQFGYPIVLAIEKENLTNVEDLYGTIAHHIERYCIVKLFEEDVLYTGKSNGDKERNEENKDDLLSPYFQQPIHTTAAVTPAGGRPMVPMSNLFNIKIFDRDANAPPTNKTQSSFPTGSSVQWNTDALSKEDTILKQGQGVLLEWSVSKAQQIFGRHSSSSSQSTFEHDHHSEINTEAWREYEELASNIPLKKTRMTTRSAVSKITCTLEDCLNEFTGDERLSSDDLWFCPRCKKHQRASKKFDIWKLPEIMVVHLKRFSQVRRWGNKIDTFIDFPIEGLDMTDRVLSTDSERLIYDLYAVDNHYGGMGGGHYTAYAQNIQNKTWYNFDDSHVNKITTEEIKTNAAYLLFYKRRQQ